MSTRPRSPPREPQHRASVLEHAEAVSSRSSVTAELRLINPPNADTGSNEHLRKALVDQRLQIAGLGRC